MGLRLLRVRNGGQSPILQLKPGSILTLQCSQSFSYASALSPSPPPTYPSNHPSIHPSNHPSIRPSIPPLLHPTCRPTPSSAPRINACTCRCPSFLPPRTRHFSALGRVTSPDAQKPRKEKQFELSYLFPDAIIPPFPRMSRRRCLSTRHYQNDSGDNSTQIGSRCRNMPHICKECGNSV